MSGRSCTRGVLRKRASSKSGTLGFNSWSIVSASDHTLSVPVYSILDTFSILSYGIGNAQFTTCRDRLLFATAIARVPMFCDLPIFVRMHLSLGSRSQKSIKSTFIQPLRSSPRPRHHSSSKQIHKFPLYQLPHARHLASRPQFHHRNQMYWPLKSKTKVKKSVTTA